MARAARERVTRERVCKNAGFRNGEKGPGKGQGENEDEVVVAVAEVVGEGWATGKHRQHRRVLCCGLDVYTHRVAPRVLGAMGTETIQGGRAL